MIKLKIFLIASLCACSNVYSEVTTSDPYCDVEKVIAIKAQTLNQQNYQYKLAIKDLQNGREKLSSSKKINNELVFRIVQAAYATPRYTKDSMKPDAIRSFSEVNYSRCLKLKHYSIAYVE